MKLYRFTPFVNACLGYNVMNQKQEDIKDINVHQVTIQVMNLPGLEETLMTQPSCLPVIMLKLFLPEGDAQKRNQTIRERTYIG